MLMSLVTMSDQNSCLREVRESQKIFSALVNSMEKRHKAVVAAIEERQREEEKRVETLVKELEQEIQELNKEDAESVPQIPLKDEQSDDTEHIILVSKYTCRHMTLWRSLASLLKWYLTLCLCHEGHHFHDVPI